MNRHGRKSELAAILQKERERLIGFSGVSETAMNRLADVISRKGVVVQREGHWEKYSSDEWICSECQYDKYCDTLDGGVLPPFCEECGARMLNGGEDDEGC